MPHLYHGSGYKHTELKPGIHYTGKKVEWDQTESNEWLYATCLLEEAIAQGFASVIEKHYKLDHYHSVGNEVVMTFTDTVPKQEDLEKLQVFLYKIDWDTSVWIKVNNLHNGMSNEYKTKACIPANMIDSCVEVDLKGWLKRKKVVIKASKASLNW
ncbi:hypothetical protein D3C76_25570 [compost metagenome]